MAWPQPEGKRVEMCLFLSYRAEEEQRIVLRSNRQMTDVKELGNLVQRFFICLKNLVVLSL